MDAFKVWVLEKTHGNTLNSQEDKQIAHRTNPEFSIEAQMVGYKLIIIRIYYARACVSGEIYSAKKGREE